MSLARTTHRSRVEWIDTDAAGIHHNTTVARFVEAAEATLMHEHGLDGAFAVTPRVRYEVDFEGPLFFGQEVTTTLAVDRIGTTSMTFVFEVWGEPHGGAPRRRAARGRYVTVHVARSYADGATATPWPDDWVSALSA